MKTSTKIGIIVGIVVALVIVGIVSGLVINGMRHHNFCVNWSNNIDKEKQDIGNQIFSDQLNNEISNYNRECAY
jgi:hypothetical protein